MSDVWRSRILLGTQRIGAAPAPCPHPLLAASWHALPWQDAEAAQLGAAALLAAARAAGHVAASGATTPPQCATDTAPVVPAAAAAALRSLLAGDHARCLPEWLSLAARRGCIVAPRDLPALLDRGTNDAALRPAIAALLGERGRWLAALHRAWPWVAGNVPVTDDAWQTGSLPERVRWLAQTAARDADAAGQALAAVWREEGGDAREALLGALVRRPPPGLAPWLEQHALRDRRAAVRQLARAALVRLPGCAFAQRAIARATPLLTQTGLLRKQLALALPPQFDPAWRDDGVEERPTAGLGPRAHWAIQLLANVPLDAWLAHFGCEAATLFARNRDPESRATLTLAWIEGQRLSPTAAAADAFARACLAGDAWPQHAPDRTAFARAWLAELPPAAVADVTDALVADGGELLTALVPHVDLAAHARDPAALAAAIEARVDAPARTAAEAEALAVGVPAAAVPLVAQRLATRPTLGSAAEAFARTLDFRRTYLPAFAAPHA